MIYLSSPYSDDDSAVRDERFQDACQAAAQLMRLGHVVFSPVAHSHPIAFCGLPTDWDFWERHDKSFLERCDEMVVLMLDGWKDSVGVQKELQMASELGKPVWYWLPVATLARVGKEKGL